MKVSIRELGAYLAFLFAPLMTPLWAGDIDHFIPPGVSFTRNTVLEGHVFAGTNDGWIGAPDFLLEAGICVPSGAIHPNCDGTPKLHVRGLLTRDVNDSPDLAVGRAEFRDPNGMACTPPHDGPTNCLPIDLPTGTPIGGWVWQAYGRRTDGSFGWWTYDPPAANYGQGRIAHIYAKTAGVQAVNSRPGTLLLGATPVNNPGNPVDRLAVMPDGRVCIYFPYTNGTPGWYEIRQGNPDSFAGGWRALVTRNDPDCAP
jgi:hypothetical protein